MGLLIEPVVDVKATLGEAALWDYKLKKLLWVDIENGNLYFYNPSTKTNSAYSFDKRIGTVVPTDSGQYLVALQDGIYVFSPQNGELTKKIDPENIKEHRYNDGKCDPAGRFWVGTMALDTTEGAASLYLIKQDFAYETVLKNVTISNGIVWSLDNTKMYYIDTPTHTVVEFEYDLETGKIGSSKIAIEIPEDLGSPDGSTLDEEGMIWIAMFGGGCVTRWNPRTGKLLQKIDVPAHNVTSCAFGGNDLNELYITTGSMEMDEKQKEKYPDAGKLFMTVPGIKGINANYFKQKL
jgi:sugar lactone lactonase YvrE